MAPLDRILPAATAEILLVAVAVVAGLMVVTITLPIAEQSTSKGPTAMLDATANESAIELCHESGDNLVPDDLVIILETESGEESVRTFTDTRAGNDYDPVSFGAGECVLLDAPANEKLIRLRVGHVPSNQTLLDTRVELESTDALVAR